MYQTAAKKTPPLLLLANGRRVKNKIIDHFLVPETADRNKRSNNDND
jgi:hypothetical protein